MSTACLCRFQNGTIVHTFSALRHSEAWRSPSGHFQFPEVLNPPLSASLGNIQVLLMMSLRLITIVDKVLKVSHDPYKKPIALLVLQIAKCASHTLDQFLLKEKKDEEEDEEETHTHVIGQPCFISEALAC